ncbi:MAG: hypothetical protein CL583_15265 [Alteromonadaceae bacterium]|nr:hypothetical protein [Alteromonadaceae bacterium]
MLCQRRAAGGGHGDIFHFPLYQYALTNFLQKMDQGRANTICCVHGQKQYDESTKLITTSKIQLRKAPTVTRKTDTTPIQCLGCG